MNFLSYYLLGAPTRLVYMLQQVEYNPLKFMAWVAHIPHLGKVQKRQTLHKTARAKGMLVVAYLVWAVPLIGGIVFSVLNRTPTFLIFSLVAPLVCIVAVFTVTLLVQRLVVDPVAKHEVTKAKKKLAGLSATRIAVLGSYGKTTMKELLKTVLSTGKKVAATPGNKNVLISHARWINNQLSGDEEVLIFEYGEAGPGDIARLAAFSLPEIAIITGLAPTHMDAYPTLEAVADDLASIQSVVPAKDCFINNASELLKSRLSGNYYGPEGLDDIQVSNINVSIKGLSFTIERNDKKIELKSDLLGRHQIGPLVAVIAIAFRLGLSDEKMIEGISKTAPFEHRMRPYQLAGAWVIDDSYNGNIEGVRAGLELLKELAASRKVYVTPGLVDQGSETERVHMEMGRLIGNAEPDRVVLMQNSATAYIQQGLKEVNYMGELKIETEPLNFYSNLEHFVATGDLVMLQNDWTDNYQ